MMLLQIQNLHSEASKIRFEATNTLQTFETYANTRKDNQYEQKNSPYNNVLSGGAQPAATYLKTRGLIAAGESIM